MRTASILSLSIVVILLAANFASAQVDLVWEAESTTPAEYLGKPLVGPQAKVKVAALPWIKGADGNFTPSNQLWFWWHKDGEPIEELSGLGKNTFSYTARASGSNQIALIVRDKAYGELARALVTIPVSPTQINFYEEDSVLGKIYHKALASSHQLVKPETTFVAEPLFFSPNSSLNFVWKLAGRDSVSDTGRPNINTISLPKGGGEGNNLLEVMANNPTNSLQVAKQTINLLFNTNSTSFYGNTF